MKHYSSASEAVRERQPQNPIICYRPHALQSAAHWFLKHFKGKILYAVKANNSPHIIKDMINAGIKAFDVAALEEIKNITPYGDMALYYMNPFKPRHMIKTAFHDYGVRDFVLDTQSELEKILQETAASPHQLNLHLRIAIPNNNAAVPLSGKFGATPDNALRLLKDIAHFSKKPGISFHVGSQCLAPQSYSHAIAQADRLSECAGITPYSLDIGGGFPVQLGIAPLAEPLDYITAIDTALHNSTRLQHCQLLAEPGRALVAESESLIVQVIHREGNMLTINDGAFGCLFEGSKMYYSLPYPIRLLTHNTDAPIVDFTLQGPTCDSSDMLPGPYSLPDNVAEGDWLEIGNIGAYGSVLSSRFNGFGEYDTIILKDAPLLSRYNV